MQQLATMTLDESVTAAWDLLKEKRPDLTSTVDQTQTPVEVRRWIQTFGSTAGPRGGIGGAAMTSFTITTVRILDVAFYFLADGFGFSLDLSNSRSAELYTNKIMPQYRDVSDSMLAFNT